MLSSISPLGERARASRWWLTTTVYVLASTLAGAALGTLLGAVGSLAPDDWRGSPFALVGAAVVVLAGLALDLRVGGLTLPSWRRQVDERWLGTYRGWVTGIGFGAQLGLGLVTIITSSTTYAVLVLELLSGRWWAGALIGGTFGLVRALPLLLTATVRGPAQLHSLFRGVERWARPADALARVSLAVVTTTLVAAGLR